VLGLLVVGALAMDALLAWAGQRRGVQTKDIPPT
jgi:hypothetical protein